jgi:hypothetical protein
MDRKQKISPRCPVLATASERLSVHQSHSRGSLSLFLFWFSVFLHSAENNVKHNKTASSGPEAHYVIRLITITIIAMRSLGSVVG